MILAILVLVVLLTLLVADLHLRATHPARPLPRATTAVPVTPATCTSLGCAAALMVQARAGTVLRADLAARAAACTACASPALTKRQGPPAVQARGG